MKQANALKRARMRQLIWKAMDKYGIGLAAATRMIMQKLARDPEWELLKDNIKVGVAHLRGKNPKRLTMAKLKKVKSIGELARLAEADKNYAQLAIIAASNLGKSCKTVREAIGWLSTNANETSEKGVVGEINYCRDLVKHDTNPKKRRTKRHAKNPHLRSGKWQFVGMFEKRDIKQVKRILRVHGMKTKVTKDHYKQEPGMRELYVERGAFATAYRAIASLFVSDKHLAA